MLDVKYGHPSYFVFFLKIAIAIHGRLWFHTNFWNVCSMSVKYAIGILIGTALNLYIVLGSIDILMMLILPIHEIVYASIYLCLP